MAELRVGISGWRYPSWRGKFYPPKLPQNRELNFAASCVNSVEINGSFTHSSLMRELNVDPKLVADQQGHTLDVNINVYTQTSLESRIDAVNTLESALIN